jgi:error-prone DNA polymerase
MLPGPAYVELRCRSSFSFLEAASNPEDLVRCAADLDYPALALGDRDGVYGAPRFHQAALAAGIRPIVGADIATDLGRLLLLVESRRGYRNLCRLLTLGHAGSPKGELRVAWEEIDEHADGLVALARGDRTLSPRLLDRALAAFGRGRLWVDVSRHLDRAAEAVSRRAAALAEAQRIPVVATNDVAHARPEGRRLLDALTCLRLRTTLDRAGRRLAAGSHPTPSGTCAGRARWPRASPTDPSGSAPAPRLPSAAPSASGTSATAFRSSPFPAARPRLRSSGT